VSVSGFLYRWLAVCLLTGCVSYTPIRSPEKGSIDNAICTPTVSAQRQYLNRLRYKGGSFVKYERQQPILDSNRNILDPYHIWPDRDGFSPVFGNIMATEAGTKPEEPRLLYFRLAFEHERHCSGSQIPPDFELDNKKL